MPKLDLKKIRPKFFDNITKKMMVTWAASFFAFLIIVFGAASLILLGVPKTSGLNFTRDGIEEIRFSNGLKHQSQNKSLRISDSKQASYANTILDLLDQSTKTNMLSNIFRGAGKIVTERTGGGDISTSSTFIRTYGNNNVMVVYNKPMGWVERISSSRYEFKRTNEGSGVFYSVYGAMIPIVNTADRITEQTWYLITSDPERNDSYYSAEYRVTTYANYNPLWKYLSTHVINV